MKKIIILSILILLLFTGLFSWEDEDLFTTIINTGAKPNVVFLMDRSGSMRSLIYHPEHDPNWQIPSSEVNARWLIHDLDRLGNIRYTKWHSRWLDESNNYLWGTPFLDVSRVQAWNKLRIRYARNYPNSSTHFFEVGDWIVQRSSSNDAYYSGNDISAYGKISYIHGPYSYDYWSNGRRYTSTNNYDITLTNISGPLKDRRTGPAGRISSVSSNSVTIDAQAASHLSVGDWLLTVNGTATGKITGISGGTITLDDTTIEGTFTTSDFVLITKCPKSSNRKQRMIKIYGCRSYDDNNLQGNTRTYDNSYNYYKWLFGIASYNEDDLFDMTTQAGQINSFYNLGKEITDSYMAKVKPPASLLTKWNNVHKKMFPAKIANLEGSISATDTVFKWVNSKKDTDDKDIMESYSAGTYIKIDAEVMQIVSHNITEKTLTVSRGAQNTHAASHDIFSQILVKDETLYSPVTTLYSACQPIIEDGSANQGQPDPDWTDGNGYYRYRMVFTRNQVAREALGIAANTLKNGKWTRDKIMMGLFRFAVNTYHSGLLTNLTDFGEKNGDGTYKNSLNPFLNAAWSIDASTGTPLAIALADVWQYFKPGNSTAGNYMSGEGYSPVTSNFGHEVINGELRPKGSPIKYWCQRNYCILITDGQAYSDKNIQNRTSYTFSKDRCQRDSSHADKLIEGQYFKWNYSWGWGDFDLNDPLNTSSTRTYCPQRTCWDNTGSTDGGSDYLDDVAFFMRHQDMFPTRRNDGSPEGAIDPGGMGPGRLYDETNDNPRLIWKGDQNVVTYTIGMAIKNDMLTATANNGGGMALTASNSEELAEAFDEIIQNILLREEPMMYTTYAAPKQSIKEGLYGYIANFIPRDGHSVWEGHLKRFRLSSEGQFPAEVDTLDASSPGSVVTEEGPKPSFQWDIYDKFETRTEARKIYTYNTSGSSLIDFNKTSISPEMLGLDSSATTERDQVIDFFTNYGISTSGSAYGYKWKCGDIFHFNPTVVSSPLRWKAQFDQGYKKFYETYGPGGSKERKEVIYVGANDGMLHCFETDTGNELWAFIPPSHLKKLERTALNPNSSSSRQYYVDGKAIVKDIKIPHDDGGTMTFYNDARDWKTILIFGMGIGGKTYCCLDITDPDDVKFMWEFSDPRLGYTEAKAVVTDIYNGTYTFPAVFISGGYNKQEVAADSGDTAIPTETKLEGKSFYVINASDGSLVKKFQYGTGGADTDTLYEMDDLKYAVTAPPVLYDKNNDGVADYAYMLDTGSHDVADNAGGQIWKINISGITDNWKPVKVYQADAGQTFWLSPTLGYDENYKLWLMAGTGRRSRPTSTDSSGNYDNLSGQTICFIDDDTTAGQYPIKNTELKNVTTAIETSTEDTVETANASGTAKRGFYFNFKAADNEILYEPAPIFIANRVYLTTFAPVGTDTGTGSAGDPCSGSSTDGGKHYLYNFGIYSNGATTTIGTPNVGKQKILGFGGLSGDKFMIYTGKGNIGGFVPVTDKPPVQLDNVFGTMLWKEKKK